jgi:hypothetical protein
MSQNCEAGYIHVMVKPKSSNVWKIGLAIDLKQVQRNSRTNAFCQRKFNFRLGSNRSIGHLHMNNVKSVYFIGDYRDPSRTCDNRAFKALRALQRVLGGTAKQPQTLQCPLVFTCFCYGDTTVLCWHRRIIQIFNQTCLWFDTPIGLKIQRNLEGSWSLW